ncbi:hypothetical protein PJ985_17325 [Streptomyces sp. ACA25]|uniref:hypothetical protein n=1 Tax=Streptomyces sp. ACA25 TaxID=3022596 RepID=UPI002307DCB5|nr:hypothetical protein [Streptomyces sp. ACA25]MDB1089327.1 hypothetical protein [Streptomyces sp. ACA25]
MSTDGAAPRQDDAGPLSGTGRKPPPALELLVHGVGGATPQDMLGDPRTTRITGDGTASIHRRTDDRADRPWDNGEPLREAYSWSNLTSGNGARALWLLLLPFMIANVAHWMRPATRGHHRTHHVYDVLVRLTALSLTVLMVAGACAVALDLVAWQCAGSLRCAADSSWLASLEAEEGWWAQPGRRLTVAAALPVLLTGLLWWLSHRTWSAYESAYPPVRDRGRGEKRAAGLSLPGFWYGRGIVSRLRAAHTAAGLLTVSTALLAATRQYDGGPHGAPVTAAAGLVLGILLLLGWAGVVLLVSRHGRTEKELDEQPLPAAARGLPRASLALLALVLVHTGWDRPGWEAGGGHPGGEVFSALTVLQGALVIGLAAAARRLHRLAPEEDRGALYGLGGPAVAMMACALAGVFTAGVVQRCAAWLDPGAVAGSSETGIAGPPVLLSWQAAVVPALLLVVAVFASVAVAKVAAATRRLAPGIPERYPGEPVRPDEERSARVAAATARAGLTDSAPGLVGWTCAVSLLLGVAAVAGAGLTGRTPGELARVPAAVSGFAALSQAVGSWLLGFGVLLLLTMGRRAYRDASARRTVGILWDVGTFWPRAAHPFAPPCYAERAVPDLSWRMATWVDTTGGRIIISGHSQGSVLAAAAVWQLDAPTRSRIALLTYGSPLERLYGRWFPKYFGPTALRALRADVPCWRNLWRATDPIGGPVRVGPGDGCPEVDHDPLLDPLYYGRNLLRPLPEPLLGHSDYAAHPAYEEERARLYRRLCPGAESVPEQARERPG